MLSEEEKKAIELLKQSIDKNSELYISDLGDNTIIIVLNLIEKQQKEIEELKKITSEYNSYCVKNLPDNATMVFADTKYFLNGTFRENMISKDKIREKIKEVSNGTYDAKIILEKLLEEKKK